jgi:hypothetical protein
MNSNCISTVVGDISSVALNGAFPDPGACHGCGDIERDQVRYRVRSIEFTGPADHAGVKVQGVDVASAIDPSNRLPFCQTCVDRSVQVIRRKSLFPCQVLDALELFGDVFPQHNTRFTLPGLTGNTFDLEPGQIPG